MQIFASVLLHVHSPKAGENRRLVCVSKSSTLIVGASSIIERAQVGTAWPERFSHVICAVARVIPNILVCYDSAYTKLCRSMKTNDVERSMYKIADSHRHQS